MREGVIKMENLNIAIIGVGMGNPNMLTIEAKEKIHKSQCLIGSARMLDLMPDYRGEKYATISEKEIANYLSINEYLKEAAILVSGDVGFYSAATGLSEGLQKQFPKMTIEWVNGISSLQYFCSRCRTTWENVKTISVHGRENNLSKILAEVTRNEKTFVLTGNTCTINDVCKALVKRGLGNLEVKIGENLSYSKERISKGEACEFQEKKFEDLSVMLIHNKNLSIPEYTTHGLEDRLFERVFGGEGKNNIPMTKSEVRSITLSKLKIQSGNILYDIGSGSGSVAIEMAQRAPEGVVYAIEKNSAAVELLKRNVKRFGLSNIVIIEGEAPEVLGQLPAPDRVFIGGSSGKLKDILEVLYNKNPELLIVVNTITLETQSQCLDIFQHHKLEDIEIVQLTIAKSRGISNLHMMMGQNPVTVISGKGMGNIVKE